MGMVCVVVVVVGGGGVGCSNGASEKDETFCKALALFFTIPPFEPSPTSWTTYHPPPSFQYHTPP